MIEDMTVRLVHVDETVSAETSPDLTVIVRQLSQFLIASGVFHTFFGRIFLSIIDGLFLSIIDHGILPGIHDRTGKAGLIRRAQHQEYYGCDHQDSQFTSLVHLLTPLWWKRYEYLK